VKQWQCCIKQLHTTWHNRLCAMHSQGTTLTQSPIRDICSLLFPSMPAQVLHHFLCLLGPTGEEECGSWWQNSGCMFYNGGSSTSAVAPREPRTMRMMAHVGKPLLSSKPGSGPEVTLTAILSTCPYCSQSHRALANGQGQRLGSGGPSLPSSVWHLSMGNCKG
jgi:hypothetical protein